jgi:hypothetical protein
MSTKERKLRPEAALAEMKLRQAVDACNEGEKHYSIEALAIEFCQKRQRAVLARRHEFQARYKNTMVASCPCCGRGFDSSGDCPECGMPHGD